MASLSIKSFSVFSDSKLHNPQIHTHTSHNSFKPLLILPAQIHKLVSFFPKLHISPKFSTRTHTPTSLLPLTTSFLSLQTTISKLLSEKIVALLIGSFIFLGCINAKPVLAQPAQSSGQSETLEKKMETQNGESEDEEMYVKLLENNPRNVEALKVVVNLKMKRGKTKEALKFVERLIDIEPSEVEWRLLQALCHEMLGQFSRAKRLFKDILKQRPLLLRALHGLAMVMHKNLEGPAVFDMLNGALEVARHEKRVNEERDIRILIAQMHVVKGLLDEGLQKFQELVDENPRDFRPYLCQGIIYSLLDRKKEAQEQFELYRSLVPQEFPQRGFLDDVVLAAKTESREKLDKEFKN